jgi:hypothetical protein
MRYCAVASPFWKGTLQYTDIAQVGISWIINKGNIICFWLDRWIDNTTLASKYLYLFSVSKNPHMIVYQLMVRNALALIFNR